MPSPKKSKFDDFEKKDRVYSTVADHPIRATILTPKQVIENHHGGSPMTIPAIVFWHGGGFIVGNRLYEPWWPDWLLELAISQNALIVAPDYRLLPEASGADILDDMDAFWAWFLRTLPTLAETEAWSARPDLQHIMCAGHSAGGLIALHSAVDHPEVAVKAVVTLYAPLYNDLPEVKLSRPRMILGSWPPPPRQAEAKIRAYVQRTKGTVRTSGEVMEMWDLVACIVQQGRLPRMMNARPDPRLDIIATIKKKTLPPIWVIHGEQDSVVPGNCSMEFFIRLKEIAPNVPKILSVLPGEHNFDASLTMQETWIADGCNFLIKHWQDGNPGGNVDRTNHQIHIEMLFVEYGGSTGS